MSRLIKIFRCCSIIDDNYKVKTRLCGLNNTGQNSGTQNELGRNELWSYNTVVMSVGGDERVEEGTDPARFKLNQTAKQAL